MAKLYVFWQNPDSRQWYPVGLLTQIKGEYHFVYTKGALNAPDFVPFGRLNDLLAHYRSVELFPFFANRLLARSRRDYTEYVRWIGAEDQPNDAILILGRTGGRRATDNILLYAKPEPNQNNEFDLFFFCHGIRYLPSDAIDRISDLSEDSPIYPMLDTLNPKDNNAVALRTDDPMYIVGYIPRFFANDVRKCLLKGDLEKARARVVRVNADAPFQFRLLCRFTSPWPYDLDPCSGDEFEPAIRPELAHL